MTTYLHLSVELFCHLFSQVLSLDICETRRWDKEDGAKRPAAVLLTDARSTPPRVAAVLLLDGRRYYSDWEPDAEVLALMQQRNDSQIMGLEILSIAFGTLSWHALCARACLAFFVLRLARHIDFRAAT